MTNDVSTRTPVRVMLSEPLIAMGIAAALSDHPAIAVRVVAAEAGAADVPAGAVVVADYAQGLQLARAFAGRSRQSSPPAPRVLVMTGRDREHEVRLALELGVYGYLPVGCTLDELTDAVLALARGTRYLSSTAAMRMADSLGREALTLRENEVLGLLACGECNKSIARRLDIAIGTVKAHVKSIMEKLEAGSRTQAVTIASQRGLVEVAAHAPPYSGGGLPAWTPALAIPSQRAHLSLA